MRERAAAAGGTLRAGPGAGGGYRVVATLPVSPSDDLSRELADVRERIAR
jgi:hypothetical protein